MSGRTLLITNDFPPRPGGIQSFIYALAVRQHPASLVVYCSRWKGWEKFDKEAPFPVIRENTTTLLPTPPVARRAGAIAREYGCDRVWFGATVPLGLLAAGLKERAGITRTVGITHGAEAGWAGVVPTRGLMRRMFRDLDVATYLGEYTRSRLDRVVGHLTTLEQLAPGVDTEAFSPQVDGAGVREEYGLTGRPVVVCVSRLVPRKGQDTLIAALPLIQRQVPGTAVLLVGGGPYRERLRRLATEHGVADDVVFTGSVAWPRLPAHFSAGDVFAMPCRTRLRGLDVEGLGMVFLEASASGLPVVAGDSGGAPDAVLEGETGYVVPGRDVPAVADRIVTLLTNPDLASRLGTAGRAWVRREWRWDLKAAQLTALLDGQ